MDTTTRLLEVVPALDGSSSEAAYLLDTHWLCRYPRPTQCIFDNGSEFKGEFPELLESYGIRGIPTTVRNPQANSTIERVHRSIGDKMRTQDIKTQDEWTNFLRHLTFSLRATHHSMTAASPAQQTFGRDMFVDVAHQTDWQEQYKHKISQIKTNNQRENAHRQEWTYKPDDQVLLRRDAGVQGKMMRLFDGPFRVITIQKHGTLALDKGRNLETVRIRRIRPYKPQCGGDCQQPAVTTA